MGGVQRAEAFEVQAQACQDLGSPMYADLCARGAEDIAAGGVLADVLVGHEDDPGPSALALRLLGSVHRLVLQRRAGALAAYYPSVGGTWEPEAGWRAFRELLVARPDVVREWLDRPPQTNEVGRSTALYGGLLHLPALGLPDLPVRLIEIGCSAGLNLRADRFCYRDEHGDRFGDEASPVLLADAWRGRALPAWPTLRVVERTGCDVRPIDPATTQGRLALTAYVWPDQRSRLERLRAAFTVAADAPAQVHEQGAVDLLSQLQVRPGHLTVVWHSVMWQYLSEQDKAGATTQLERLAADAAADAPFVHLSAEPERRTPAAEQREFLVRLGTWPVGGERLLGATLGHGVPTTWD